MAKKQLGKTKIWYKRGLFSDVTLVLGDEKIKAHKVILAARSLYFEKMFTSDFKEKESDEVPISIEDPENFKLLLKFMYESYLEENITVQLMLLAEMLMVNSFFKFCAWKFCTKLTIDNAMRCLLAAVLDNQSNLEQHVVFFIRQHFSEVEKSADYACFSTRSDIISALFIHGSKIEPSPEVKNYCRPETDIDAEQYYNSDQFSDITIKVGETKIKAHKAILVTKSNVFEKLLKQCCNKENSELPSELEISKFDAINFELFLQFLYSNKLDPGQISSELLYIALEYNIFLLAKICQFRAINELSPENAAEFLYISIALGCQALRLEADQYIKKTPKITLCNNIAIFKNIETFKGAVGYWTKTGICEYYAIPLFEPVLSLSLATELKYNNQTGYNQNVIKLLKQRVLIQIFICTNQKWLLASTQKVMEKPDVKIYLPLDFESNKEENCFAHIVISPVSN